jgi:16S rRNA (guanine966-N2)-methyltransferase
VRGQARVLQADVERAIDRLAAEGARFDVVFLDPPYEADLVDATVERLSAVGLVMPDAVVIAQHLTKRPPAATFGALAAVRQRRFGETTLTFFRVPAVSSP